MSNDDEVRPEPTGGFTRRDVMRRLGLLGAAAVVAPSILAACGGDDDDDAGGGATTTAAGGATTTAAGGGATTTAGGGATTTAAGGGTPGERLAAILEIDPAGKNGKGEAFKLGAVLALTGNGSFYGKTMSRGTDLVVKQIAEAGGPTIEVIYKDHKSGDPQAGVTAVNELGADKVPAKFASYVDDLGAMFPGTAQFKMFTLDGGGGTSIFGQGIEFFWGTRAITPNDAIPGLLQYIKETMPDAKTVGLTGWDIGEPSNGIIKEDVLKKIADGGFEFNGLYELFPPNTTDFAATFTKIKANEPDILLGGMYGQDPGFFLDQSQTVGLNAKLVGFEFTPDGVNASKGAYDNVGWTFAYDYFDANNPVSPLAKLFVETFREEYGEDPDFYAANFYENGLVLWEVIRRVLAKDGNINDGTVLDAALQENLTVPSVYGGTETEIGTYTLDATTHSVNKRPMGVFEYKSGEVTPKAYFDINAEGFRMA
jgi:ABC-type branched-subunit amino acid transport system substrate-binding protein